MKIQDMLDKGTLAKLKSDLPFERETGLVCKNCADNCERCLAVLARGSKSYDHTLMK